MPSPARVVDTLAAAQLEAFNTLRALATNLANVHQARLAAMAILSMQPHAPAESPSRAEHAEPAARATASATDRRFLRRSVPAADGPARVPPGPSAQSPALSPPAAPPPASNLTMHEVVAASLDSPALPALLDSMAALPAIPPQAPRTSAETRALISRLDRFLQTPLATPERVQQLLAKSGKG
ncbi:MAG: hypothetical protein HYX51_01025 [Chloroflexi bacterium]|nr:hypothetical protein [Chloroflexota bacterium]